ncbi:GGDEF domain-containing protein [Candidatus Uhrbacteria bacterium]|nr:GGDEF domain-containing protein [Candidatus Uhrbacteria bacterium]
MSDELTAEEEIALLRAENLALIADREDALQRARELDRALISMKHKLDKARVDFLTKLPTRVVFEERIRDEIVACRRDGTCMTVLIVDLGELGLVNTAFDHGPGGDLMLLRLAKILRDSLRGSDTVARWSDGGEDTLARWGGDEFGVILHDAGMAEARVVVARIQRVVENALVRVGVGEGTMIPLKAAIGVAVGCGNQLSEGIKDVADAALGRAKKARKSSGAYFAAVFGDMP